MADSSNDRTRYTHDWASDDDIATTVETALGETLETSVENLRPLTDIVPPDALNAVLHPQDSGDPSYDGEVTVSFEYESCVVTIHRTGEIVIHSVGESAKD